MMHVSAARLAKQIEARMEEDILAGRIAGASALVWQEGVQVCRVFRGMADSEKEIPIASNSIFRLASMTKPVMAACALIAEEQGMLSIHDPVSKHFPAFQQMAVGILTPDGRIERGPIPPKEMRLIHLLTHTAGFGAGEVGARLTARITRAQKQDLGTVIQAYEQMMLLDFPPESATFYSPTAGFDLVAAIIQKVSGMAIEDFLRTYITVPLETPDLTFAPTEEMWSRTVQVHGISNGVSKTTRGMDHKIFGNDPPTYHCGGAGMVGTVEAYARFAQMLCDGGVYAGRRILSHASVKAMQTPYAPSGNAWGLGVRTVRGDRYLPDGSYGWSGAYGTHFWIDPVNRLVAVYMKNSHVDGGAGAVTARHFEADVYTCLC